MSTSSKLPTSIVVKVLLIHDFGQDNTILTFFSDSEDLLRAKVANDETATAANTEAMYDHCTRKLREANTTPDITMAYRDLQTYLAAILDKIAP